MQGKVIQVGKERKRLKKTRNQGQTLIEFILLLLVLVSLSYMTIAAFNGKIAERWTELVRIIASDNPAEPRSDITVR